MRTALILLAVVAVPVAGLAARWAWSSRRRRLAAWWEDNLGPVLHPPRTLDVAALQRRILAVALRQVSVTDRGVAVLPASFRVEVSDDDAARLRPLRHIVEAELADALGSEAVKRSWLRPERVRVGITAGDVVDGRPRVRVVLGPEAVDQAGYGTTGPAPTGAQANGSATPWSASAGHPATGSAPAGSATPRSETAGHPATGSAPAGSGTPWSASAGLPATGSAATGSATTWPATAGPATGSAAVGSATTESTAGSGVTGPATAGPATEGVTTTELDGRGLGPTGPDRFEGRGAAPARTAFDGSAVGRTVIDGTGSARSASERTGDGMASHPAGSARTTPRRAAVPDPDPASTPGSSTASAPILPPVHIPAHTPVAATGGGRPVVCELISADGGRDIDLTHRAERLTVGRVGTAVVLDDERVSSRHAELVPAPGGQWLLDDTGSLNGTWVNGRRVERASLVHGDEVRFASSGPRFLFSRLAGAGR